MTAERRRIGLIVPSSNTTVETEVPEMIRRVQGGGEGYTFHSSRAILHSVDSKSLGAMVGQLDRCANELLDADVDVILYACLIAIMAEGPGAHHRAEERVEELARERGCEDVVVSSSAGAIVRGLQRLGAKRAAIITPYVEPLTDCVAGYLSAEGVEIVSSLSLGVADNLEVGRLDQQALLQHAMSLDLAGADVLIVSACVQMPSLEIVAAAERELGLPVISAATAGTYELLDAFGEPPVVPDAGCLLAAREAT